MTKKDKKKKCDFDCGGSRSKCGGVYGLGIIGSAVYFISTATGFWSGVLGFLKALVWPAFMIFELFKFLGA